MLGQGLLSTAEPFWEGCHAHETVTVSRPPVAWGQARHQLLRTQGDGVSDR